MTSEHRLKIVPGADNRQPPAGADAPGRCLLESGAVLALQTVGQPAIDYFAYVPDGFRAGAPVLVAVHGITRNAEEIIRRFAPFAEQYRCVVVAPHYPKSAFGDYQRLGIRKKGRRSKWPRADHALERILTETAAKVPADFGRLHLFGYSGGAQFVHRYAMAYPRRVAGIAAAAAGWYTLPDLTLDYPLGIKLPSKSADVRFNLLDLLKVPTLVLVGEKDTQRDRGLRASAPVDRQQGVNRLERGRRWIRLMAAAARNYALPTRFDFQILPASGHSFAECMDNGRLGERVFAFLFDADKS